MNNLEVVKLLRYIEDGGRVQRMHKVPTIHPQNVAAHSFGVAWWVWILSDRKPSANLLMAALDHDLPEGETGDIPAPTKRRLGLSDQLAHWESEISMEAGVPVFELTEAENTILKVADSLELLQHCVRERQLGNRTMELNRMFSNVQGYAAQVATTAQYDYVSLVANQWSECDEC